MIRTGVERIVEVLNLRLVLIVDLLLRLIGTGGKLDVLEGLSRGSGRSRRGTRGGVLLDRKSVV